ncbi:50S ribosomal protein L25 [bacterium]|nr:50S ribosomal protein L25 [bacterium]
MSQVVLNIEKRENVGKQVAKRLRKEGKTPGIFYMHGEDSIAVTLDSKELYTVIHTEASIVDLKFSSGKESKCVIRDIQWHPVSDQPLHVDLMGIKMTEKVQVEVPIHLVGNPVGVKQEGGVLEQIIREISIECLPGDIPEHLEIDVSDLSIGDTFKIEQLQIDKVKILTDPSQSVAAVRVPRVILEPEVELEEEAEEPELIGEEKEEQEEESSESS